MNAINARIKRSMVCKHIGEYRLDTTQNLSHKPRLGDVAIFEIVEIGKHTTIQSPSKRNVYLLEGDQIMAAFGNRYATEQYEGYIPEFPTEDLEILGAGGAIGLIHSKNAALEHIEPTRIRLIGYCTNEQGKILNTLYHHQPSVAFTGEVPNQAKVILSLGATMDSGKTTTAAYLVAGLKRAGHRVAYMKLTGTCYSKDQDLAYDCGADLTTDFADLGYPSTFLCELQDLKDLYQGLLQRVSAAQPDFVVVEIADGIHQRETFALISDEAFMSTVSNVVFSSGDSLAALYGEQFLGSLGIRLTAFCGRFTMSPLLIREVQAHSRVPVFTLDDLLEVAPMFLTEDGVRV